MPNPYKYTAQEIKDLVEQWHMDNYIVYDLKDFIMYETKFTSNEYDDWARTGRIPYA